MCNSLRTVQSLRLFASKQQHCPLHGSFITITLENTDCLLFFFLLLLFKFAPQSSEYLSVLQLLIFFL